MNSEYKHDILDNIENYDSFALNFLLYRGTGWITLFLNFFRYPFTADQKITEPDWQIYIKGIASLMVAEQSPRKLLEIRNRFYELLTHAIPTDLIFRGLLQEVTKKCDLQLKIEIATVAAEYEHRMHYGSKVIFHLEAFAAKFMAIYKKFMDASLEGFM